jgi:3-hydroxyacyl-CoA dehydrogenase
MGDYVGYVVADGVATLLMDNPPVNALGQGLRLALQDAFAKAEADTAIGAIVLSAAGRGWPAGADIREFGKPAVSPVLPDLCAQIAQATKPVIATMTGHALGGGLELALCAALRLAAPTTVFGFPEIRLGLLPGAGGTQRLPRLIGAAAALNLMLTGAPITAAAALKLGLIDKVVTGDLAHVAQALARDHVKGLRYLPVASQRKQTGFSDPDAYLAAVGAARETLRNAVPQGQVSHGLASPSRAGKRIIDCVEAAFLLPPTEGQVFERTAFLDLMETPEARALRHVFLAERRAARSLPPKLAKPEKLASIAIVGGGGIGSGLVVQLLSAGLDVTLIEASEAALAKALARVAHAQEAAEKRGDITAEQRLRDWDRLRADQHIAAVGGADLVIEAVPESLSLKSRVLATIGAELESGVPIFSVSCAFDPVDLASASGRPDLHLSLYLTEPVRQATLVEAAGDETDSRAFGALHTLAKINGWQLLRNAPAQGVIGKRVWTAIGDAADRCLEAGAAPHEVDRAMRAYGLPMGPYELRDTYGLDHVLVSRPIRRRGVKPAPLGLSLLDTLIGADRLGRKVGGGYHGYDPSQPPLRGDPEVNGHLDRLRKHKTLSYGEIQRRIVAGLANDCAWAINDGQVIFPSDYDLVTVAQGFPRWRGGPMQVADEAGLLGLRNDLHHWAASGDRFWDPAPVWDQLVRNGRRFESLNKD